MDYMEIFNDSYEAVLGPGGQSEKFFRFFYERFVAKSPEIQEKFSHTDFERQIRMLKSSIAYMVNFFVSKKDNEYLRRVAHLHSHAELNIPPEWYHLWLDAMMEALLECYPDYNRNVELAWRIVLSPGIEFMKFHYDL